MKAWTVGHSNHDWSDFLPLLTAHRIEVVADVRSAPYSRYVPHFSKEPLTRALREAGLRYVFLGRELGARSTDPAALTDGRVDFPKLAATPLFQTGLERLLTGIGEYRVCLLCAEKAPLDCHRTALVTRPLIARGVTVHHILADGTAEPHEATEERLLDLTGLRPPPMFATAEARTGALERAWRVRERAITS